MKSYLTAFLILALVLVMEILGPVVTHISLRYYDSILHLFGGIGLGFFLYSLATSLTSHNLRTRTRVIIGVLVCGIVWEIFEMYFGISGFPFGTTLYYLDTGKDLILDTAGGALVALGMIRKNEQQP